MGFHGNEEAETDSKPESRKPYLRIFKWTFKEERGLIHGAMEVGEEREERKTEALIDGALGGHFHVKDVKRGQ